MHQVLVCDGIQWHTLTQSKWHNDIVRAQERYYGIPLNYYTQIPYSIFRYQIVPGAKGQNLGTRLIFFSFGQITHHPGPEPWVVDHCLTG